MDLRLVVNFRFRESVRGCHAAIPFWSDQFGRFNVRQDARRPDTHG